MVTLANVRDFLKAFNLFESYGIGRIEESKKNVLGIYSLKTGLRHKCIGNTEKCEIKPISLLVHGDTNKNTTEQLANSLYIALDKCEDAVIAGRKVNIIDLQQDSPIDVDVSDNKIYEFVIEVIFYIEKEG